MKRQVMSMFRNQPAILREGEYTAADLQQFKSTHQIWQEGDIFDLQLRELFEILHPAKRLAVVSYEEELQAFVDQRLGDGLQGNWIYYPWSGFLVHTVNQVDYLALRTNMNKNLITRNVQEQLFNACVGVAGL